MKKNRIIEFLKKYYKFIVLVTFVILSIIIGIKHEPWADEAQAWLIARDTTMHSLFFKYLHSEGHPALWYVLLKILQLFGLKFKYLYIVPIIFSSIGVYVFVFKSNFPWYIKCLFPFTFFIFYQYTIVARSYCLIFPLVSILATLWKDRYKKIGLFTLILILLINCETHTYLFAGSIYFYCLLESFIDFRKGIKKDKKVYICFILLFISFFLTLLYVFPTGSTHIPHQIRSYVLSDSFFTSYSANKVLKFIISLLIVLYMAIFILKNKKEIFKLVILILPIFLFLNLIYFKEWHLGIITIIFIFYIWIEEKETNLFVKLFLICVCIVQIPWSVKSSLDDYKYSYSTTNEVADFIKKYDYENLKIVNSNFYAVSVNAYFENNIFYNFQENNGFVYLEKSNELLSDFYNTDYVMDNSIDIYVLNFEFEETIESEKLIDYNKYDFDGGYIFFEGRNFFPQSFYVYVRKDIDKNKELK